MATMPEGGPKTGVLLVNLGTPDEPTPDAVKRYLAEFLSDRRVIGIPPLIWQPILRGFVLRTRPAKSAEAYRLVWTERGSPLAAITQDQAEALQERMPDVRVRYAMRYGNPSIASVLQAMVDEGLGQIIVVPLYPQYCTATTASVTDAVDAAMKRLSPKPNLQTLPPYYDEPLYIDALAGSVRDALSTLDFEPEALLVSFHGMPERTRLKGDPYYDQCLKTGELLAKALGRDLTIAFQSRFGRAKWLSPATDATLTEFPSKGIKRIAIIAPGFAADCIETLEELAIRGRETFEEAGGERFAYIPCLNASEAGMMMLETLVRREIAAAGFQA